MQDKAIAAIGEWQLEEKQKNQRLEPVDLYVENMFPGKDWQMLLLDFKVMNDAGNLFCKYNGIDIEKVSSEKEDYRKYAYRKGSARGGDVTFSTKLGFPVNKKLKTIKETTFKKIFAFTEKYPKEAEIFRLINQAFGANEEIIKKELTELFRNFDNNQRVSTGLSFKINIDGNDKFLGDFAIIKLMIIESGSVANYTHAGTESRANDKVSSLSGVITNKVFGFAAPFKYSSPDKPGFISGFFNKKSNWRNYPIGANETLILETGRKFIQQNLTGYFYGHEYMMVPHPIVHSKTEDLKQIITFLKIAFDNEKKIKKERKKGAEDQIQKLIAQERNYFNLDILFYKEDKKTGAISIELMLEEILPSRFRQLFIDTPHKINKNPLFKNAITIKKEQHDLAFSFQILKDFFDDKFLDVVNTVFLGKHLSKEFIFEHITALIRKKHNDSKTKEGFVEPLKWIVLKAVILLSYLTDLSIITNNINYQYMDIESKQKTESRFNLERFNEFVKGNKDFLDSDIKTGIFAVGVLIKFLFDIQSQSLNTSNPPFESKLKGYKLNPEVLMNVYTEALSKIQKYQKNAYVYMELRAIINKYFILQQQNMKQMTNNELSFFFVAGLELGKEFKREKNSEQTKNN